MSGKELAPDLHIVILEEGMMTQFPEQYLYTHALKPWLLTAVDIRRKPTAEKAFLLPKVSSRLFVPLFFFFLLFLYCTMNS